MRRHSRRTSKAEKDITDPPFVEDAQPAPGAPASLGAAPDRDRLAGGDSKSRQPLAGAAKPVTGGKPEKIVSPRNRSAGKRALAGEAVAVQVRSAKRQPPMADLGARARLPAGQAGTAVESAAATTVVEAHEAGEQARFRDDAMWALDGLTRAAAPGTQRDSLATLLEICSNRRGRLALRSKGLAEDVLAATANLELGADAVLALAAAAVLLAFCQADADAFILGRPEVAKLACKLLQFNGAMPAGGPVASRILRALQETPHSRLLPPEAAFNPQSVALAALAAVLDPHNSSIDTDPLKHALRAEGLLEVAAQLAADQDRALVDSSPTMHTVQALWRMNRALLVLENSCFACSENEARLVGIEITRGVPPLVARIGMAQWLVLQVQALGRQGLVLGLKKDCLRGLLAVLMNMTQNNAAGCNSVVQARALEAVPPLLANILQSGQSNTGGSFNRDELNLWVDELSSCLGLLINLVENDKELRMRLRSSRLPGVCDGGGAEGVGMVALLSRLMSTAAAEPKSDSDRQQGDRAADQRRASVGGDEVTLDTLEHGEGEGAASIVEVYAAILLGFLIEGHRGAQEEATALLPGNTIAPVVAAVARCLQFYVSADAITKSTEEALRDLLAALKEQEAAPA